MHRVNILIPGCALLQVHRSWARMGLAPELLLFLLPEAGRYCTILMPDLSKLGYQRVSSLDDQLRAEAKALALEKLKRVPDTEGKPRLASACCF